MPFPSINLKPGVEMEGIPVISATRFVVPMDYSHYFKEHPCLVVDVYQDGRVITRREAYRRDGSINRESLGLGANPRTYGNVSEFRAAHPVQAAEIIKYLREQQLHLPWVEDRAPDLQPKTHKCRWCGEEKHLLDFPQTDGNVIGVHDDCCECRRKYCSREKVWCIANLTDKCNNCSARKALS